jgi:hypothetical protein
MSAGPIDRNRSDVIGCPRFSPSAFGLGSWAEAKLSAIKNTAAVYLMVLFLIGENRQISYPKRRTMNRLCRLGKWNDSSE